MIWKTSRREINLSRPLVMGILNVTPDSFSDGGKFFSLDDAFKRAQEMISDGADIIDIGGESTRPGSARVNETEEIERVVPVIEAIRSKFDIPISIDTSKSAVAVAAVDAGVEIVNDISGLRFDEHIADVAAQNKTGLILMHSRGEFETMHSQPPVEDIFADVTADFHRSIAVAEEYGVSRENIVLDIGIGFGKTLEQNLALIARLDVLTRLFVEFPILAGTSRKSFIGKILGEEDPKLRFSGSLATAAIAVWNGATIIRAHDVRQTVEAVAVVSSLKGEKSLA